MSEQLAFPSLQVRIPEDNYAAVLCGRECAAVGGVDKGMDGAGGILGAKHFPGFVIPQHYRLVPRRTGRQHLSVRAKRHRLDPGLSMGQPPSPFLTRVGIHESDLPIHCRESEEFTIGSEGHGPNPHIVVMLPSG
jgi:hypothetical protein